MKKLGILTCAALASLCTANLSAAVESDIVGYTTITMEADKWYAIGTPFQQLDGSDSYQLMDVFGNGFSEGDILYIFNPDTSAFSTILKWKTVNGKEGWGLSALPVLQNPTLTAGTGILINKKTAGEIVFSGKVDPLTSTVDGQGWAYVVVQYPEEKLLRDLSWEGFEDGDELYILNPTTNAFSTILKRKTVNGVAGWCKGSLPILDTTTTISIGQSILIRKVSAGQGSVSF